MKKTLAAVAVLGAFAGSALAADVQLYGIVDTGFQYLHTDADASRAVYDGAGDCRIKQCLIAYVSALTDLSDICKCKILHVLIRHATPHIFSKICQSDAHRAD